MVSFLGQYYSPADLLLFQKSYNTPAIPIATTLGPNDASKPGVEASLDVQYLTGVTGAEQGNAGTLHSYGTPYPVCDVQFVDLMRRQEHPYVGVLYTWRTTLRQ